MNNLIIEFDLLSLAATARDYDSKSDYTTHLMKPSGFIVSEGRSGLTVISNAIAVEYPQSTRVVVENPDKLGTSQSHQRCSCLRIPKTNMIPISRFELRLGYLYRHNIG
eukprot:9473359-Ditylum_brightwellii.AAC.1